MKAIPNHPESITQKEISMAHQAKFYEWYHIVNDYQKIPTPKLHHCWLPDNIWPIMKQNHILLWDPGM